MARMMAAMVAAGLAVSSMGCATIFSGTTQMVPVESEPPGATVKLDGVEVGTTPLELEVTRGSERRLLIEKAGFEPHELMLEKKLNGWFIGNALIGGIIGIAIDVGTGSWMWVDPEEVRVELMPTGSR